MKNLLYAVVASATVFVAPVAVGEAVPSVSGDTWTFTLDGNDTYSGSIAAAGRVVKAGSGTLTLTGSSSGFTGAFDVEGGVLTASSLAGFGAPTAINVTSDAQFKTPANSGDFATGNSGADVTFAGDGPDGNGALYIQCGANKNFFKSTKMTGDASISVTAQAAVFGSKLDMQGYTLTMKGAGPWKMNMSDVEANDPAGGSRHAKIVSNCNVLFQNRCRFKGGADNSIVNGGTGIMTVTFQSSREGIPWMFDAGAGGLNFAPTASTVAYTNIVSGPVVKKSSSSNFRFSNSSGTTAKLAGNVFSQTTIENRGNTGTTNWISGELTAIGGVKAMGGTVILDGIGRHYLGNSTVSDNWTAGSTTTYAPGFIFLRDMGEVTNSVIFRLNSSSAARQCELAISGTANFKGTGSGSSIFMAPRPGGVNIVDLRAGTEMLKCNFLMGVYAGQDSAMGASQGTNAQNAVYFRGATLSTRNGGGTQDVYISNDHESYGYIGMTAGNISSYALHLGAGYESVGGPSVVHMKGGSLTVPGIVMNRGGRDSVYWQTGGSMTSQNAVVGISPSGNFDAADGESVIAFSGANTRASVSRVDTETTRDARLTVALNDGAVVEMAGFKRKNPVSQVNSEFHFAANGGVIDKIQGATAMFDTMDNPEYGTATFTLYDEGLVFNVESNKCLNPGGTGHYPHELKLGFSNPSGKSIMSIALPSDVAFLAERYVGAPIVRISDTTGKGAAALAEFDEETRRVTGIAVVAPGFGFSDSPSVKIASADHKTWYACAATVGFRTKAGGFTKTGDGQLSFKNNCNNTYAGATRVLGGTLGYGISAYPTNSAFEVAAGATLNFAGVGSSVRRVNLKSLSGSGRIVAGSSTNGSNPGVREIVVREGFSLAAGAPLVTDGAVNWDAGAVLTVANAEALDDSGKVNILMQADGGILGDVKSLVLSGLSDERWRVVKRNGVLGVKMPTGFMLILR